MAAVLIRPNAAQKSRLRLFVVQALVLSLFFTLFARLWYMQVAHRRRLPGRGRRAVGARRRRPAGPRADRRRHGPPAGRQPQQLGGQHRPHPAGQARRPTERDDTLRRSPASSASRAPRSTARILLCGQPGSKAGTCWNGSPYQPVPVARDVPQRVAVKVLEQSEDYPGVLAQQESVRAYPSPYGVNGAAPARLPQPDHRRRARRGRQGRRHLAQRRLGRGPGRRGEVLRLLPARHPGLHEGGRRLDGPRARRLRRGASPSPATPWSPRSTPTCRPTSRSSCTSRSRPPAAPSTRSPARTTSPTAARPW